MGRLPPHCLIALGLSLCATGALLGEPEESRDPSPLSHEALFAPNKTFPYFADLSYSLTEYANKMDLGTAAFLAQCSLLAYVKELEFIEAKLRKAGFNKIDFIAKKGAFVFVASSEEDVVICFRGTETGDATDYLSDAKVQRVPFGKRGKAHYGFVEALGWIKENLDTEVEATLASGAKRIWITGHSLGGAMGTLYAMSMEHGLAGVYTMGAPRVANKALAKATANELPLYRFINNTDIIPRILAKPFYYSIGASYFITAEGYLIRNPSFESKWKSRWKGHKETWKALFFDHWAKGKFDALPSKAFIDHSPRLYAEAIMKLAKARNGGATLHASYQGFGAGSWPEPPHGWQRRMRRAVK